jgi:hypothetical protein
MAMTTRCTIDQYQVLQTVEAGFLICIRLKEAGLLN